MKTNDYIPYIESCQNNKPSSSFEDIPDSCIKNLVIPPVNEYISAMEKTYGENIGTDITSKQIASYLTTGMYKESPIVFWSEKSGVNYTFWDRIKKVFNSFEIREFNWLDITPTYVPIYGLGKTKKRPDSKIKNSFGEVRYYFKGMMDDFEKNNISYDGSINLDSFGNPKTFQFFYCKQTYFHRLQRLWRGICRDFLWVPPQFKHYLDNKPRLDWFRSNVWKYFFSYGKEQKEAREGLLSHGYNVEENHVYFDHAPSMKRN
jgi:hypothetical protein